MQLLSVLHSAISRAASLLEFLASWSGWMSAVFLPRGNRCRVMALYSLADNNDTAVDARISYTNMVFPIQCIRCERVNRYKLWSNRESWNIFHQSPGIVVRGCPVRSHPRHYSNLKKIMGNTG